MTDRRSKFCRDARAIAAAWGAHVYAQRGQRARQLAPVLAAAARPDFPAKQKRGWLRSDVETWGRTNVAAEGRIIIISELSSADQANGANGNGRQPNLIPQDKTEADKIRKQSIWLRYTKGQRVSAEDKRFAGIPDSDGSGPGDIIGGGQEGVAEYIRNNYPGCVCNKMDISRWMRGLHLPSGCTENFPPSPLSYRHKKSLIQPWVEKYLVKTSAPGELPLRLDYRSEKERLDFERSQEEFKLWRQEHDNKYMLVDDHERTLAAAGQTVKLATRETMEVQLPKILAGEMAALLKESVPERLLEKLNELVRFTCRRRFDDWQIEVVQRLAALAKPAEDKKN